MTDTYHRPTKAEIKARQAKMCRHFTGWQDGTCKAGIAYPEDVAKLPCRNEMPEPCPGYHPYTIAELEARDAENERRYLLIKEGKSPCCEEPIDTSRVTQAGQFKNHGPRYCSKCKALLFIV